MKRQSIVFLSWILLSLIVSACGSKSVNVSMEMNEFKFTPDTFEVPAGAEVNLTLENTGALEHDMVIMILGQHATTPFDGDDEESIFWEQKVDAGESVSVTFTAPTEPGEYQFVCGIPAHLEQGMEGTMIVK
jgi:plastocyanin